MKNEATSSMHVKHLDLMVGALEASEAPPRCRNRLASWMFGLELRVVSTKNNLIIAVTTANG
jgi:hypothetical protein